MPRSGDRGLRSALHRRARPAIIGGSITFRLTTAQTAARSSVPLPPGAGMWEEARCLPRLFVPILLATRHCCRLIGRLAGGQQEADAGICEANREVP